jgi:5-methylthioribose kinase
MPKLLGVDRINNVLQLEDLGDSEDFTYLYQKGSKLSTKQLKQLISFASTLHNSISSSNGHPAIENMEMRKLNHEHIFLYPYLENNGLNLDSICKGLSAAASSYKTDVALKEALQPLGERYLQTGNSLLHGDFFPGSWLKTKNDIKIIDAEFCYFGDPEFEMGVMLAHLHLADQGSDLVSEALELYQSSADLDAALTKKYMAVEILRRILGLAQLPLTIDLEKRIQLIAMSRGLLVA